MNINKLSSIYQVRRLDENNVSLIYSLCSKNKLYYTYYPPFVTLNSIKEDLKALPEGKQLKDKYFLGFFLEEKLIAIFDLIMFYPDYETAFIGLFMCDINMQNKGIGTALINGICSYLKEIKIKHLRLAWVKDNPQASHFWFKNGFEVIKEVINDDIVLCLGNIIR